MMAFQTLILWLSMFNASFTSNLKIPAHQQFYLGPTEKVRNASDARRQGEAVYPVLRAAGNEADDVFLANEMF